MPRSLLPEIWRSERGVLNPMREMNRLQRRIDRMFDEFFEEPTFPSLFRPTRLFPRMEEIEFEPPCDVTETDTHYLLSFDLPGVKKDEVKIDLSDNQLTVSGERKEEHKGAVSRERYYGAFCRSFTLPQNVDANKVEANYENGVLQIALPKTAVAPGKQIPIKEGKLIEAKAEKAA